MGDRISKPGSRLPGLWGLGAAMLATTCGGPSETPTDVVVRSDSAGVEIVTSAATDRILEWSYEEVFRIGGEADGPASFTRVGTSNLGSDTTGNVYVMDSDASRVVVFGPEGSHLRSMGGEGGGPGEFQFPIGVSVTPGGTTAVFDVGKGSLVLFGADGSALPQVPFPHYTDPGVRHFAKTDAGVVVARSLRLEEARGLELAGWGDAPGSDTVSFVRTEYEPPEMVDFGCMGLALRPIFSPTVRWATTGDLTAVVTGPGYRIDFHAPDGRIVRSIRRDIPLAPAAFEDAVAESEPGMRMQGAQSCEITAREVAEGRGFEESIPAIRRILLASDGTLWVERFHPGGPGAGVPGTIDVFDATGAYAGSLPEGSRFPILLLADDRLAYGVRDAFDVQRLVVARISRR
jgi:hypothetical protein